MADWPYNTARWQRLRRHKLDLQPQCEPCDAMGRLTLANTVDHRVPISDGGEAFPATAGLTSMCAACHSAKTARGVEAGAARSTRARKGCDADGWPLDPAHPWNVQKSLRADGLGPPSYPRTQFVSDRNGSDGSNG